MKISFIIPPSLEEHPPAERVFGCNYGVYPIPNIFILYVAAILEKNGYEVKYIDAVTENWDKNKFEEYINNDNSDIYSFYTVFLSEETDKKAHKIIRKLKRNKPIIFFGPQPTFKPEKYIFDEKTFVVRGEPEYTFLELVQSLKKNKSLDKIKGISFLKNKKIIHTETRGVIENLNDLPFPARHLLNSKNYYNPKFSRKPFTVMITSRGCSHRCYYCIPNSSSFARELEWRKVKCDYSKPGVGLRSSWSVIEEFKQLKKEGYASISILDDQFIWGEKRAIEICNGIKKLDIEWGCLSRADHLNEKIVKAMSEAGCKYIDIGIESFDQKILDDIKKDMKVETLFKAITLLKKYKIDAKLNILMGVSPLQTKKSINKDIEISKRIGADLVMFQVCTPFPGTEFHDIALKNGWITTGDYIPTDPLKQSIIEYPNLSNKELKELLKKANKSFYLRLSYIFGRLIKTTSLSELKENIRTAWRLFGEGNNSNNSKKR
ncbi:MAG: radical SAM protein [Candidatus Aenigmarchaeota archaeon]|nr:radical SAM protein [Candidatus Aenigmarchaeota archaeon]